MHEDYSRAQDDHITARLIGHGKGTAPIPPPRGFGKLTPEKRREIASQGGKAAHAMGKAHRFSGEEAVEAGRRGGTLVSQNRDHMAAIGRKGGDAKKAKKEAS